MHNHLFTENPPLPSGPIVKRWVAIIYDGFMLWNNILTYNNQLYELRDSFLPHH